MEAELRVLMVEDVPTDAELEIRELKRAGLRVAHRLVDTEDGFRGALRDFRPNLIISDFSMPHFDGMFALKIARELAPDVPFIFVSGTIGEEYAIRALKNGATDYVLKNNLLRLPASVERALQESAERLARLKMQRELEETRSRLDSIVSSLPDVVWSVSPSPYKVLYASAAFESLWGIPVVELHSDPEIWIKAVHPEDRAAVESAWHSTLAGQGMLDAVFRVVQSERGEVRWIHDRAIPIRDAAGGIVRIDGLARDITKLKEQEARIERLSRIRAVLSGINSAIVRIRDTQQLFDEACRIAVEHGKFGIAWIGRYDPTALEVTPQASAGLDGDYHLMGARLKVGADSPTASGLIAHAVRERRATYSNDITAEPEVGGQRRQEAIRRGYRSVCALPLLVEGSVAGTLSLFAKETNFFDEEEMKLLAELAGDISFALEHIGGQKRIEKLSRVRAVSSGINAAIVRIRDRADLLEETCRIASEVGKFEMVWIGTLHPEEKLVRPVAWSGFTRETAHAVTWATIEAAKGPVGEAIQGKKVAVRNDIETAMPTGMLRKEAISKGCYSTACMPLIVDGEVVGAISLYAGGRGAFDEDELALLSDVASNVSFALESIERQDGLERLSRIRNVLGEMNAAIVRIRDKQQLFQEACRIAVEHGKFGLSWIGLLDAGMDVTPVAWAGHGSEEINKSKTTARADAPQGQGLVGQAIREGKAAFNNDISVGPKVGGQRREQAIRLGYRSLMALPLSAENAAVGVFALFVKEANFFDDEEIALLTEFAGNISFALQSIERQTKIDRLSRIRNVLGEMNAAIVRIRSKQQLFEEACRITVEHGKFAMSWIGAVDAAAQEIKPVAKAGAHEGYLEHLKLTLDPTATRHMALAVEALGRSAPVVCNDIATDGRMRVWRQAALGRGYRSTVMLPLMVDQRGVGVFGLYSAETGFFDADEMKLLIELAGDISFALQTIEKQEKLDYLSYYDQLTGLPNRTLFHDRVNQALQTERESGGKVALIFFDLQRFGIVNDTYGRQTGDKVLRSVAERLEKALGGRDYLARVAADTFAAVLRDVKHEADVAHVLEQGILSAVAKPFEIGGEQLRIAAQAGIVLFPGDGNDAETLFRNADAALNKAKASGDTYLFYAPQMNAQVAKQLRLETDLRNAIVHEQFVLHYQPRYDLATNQILGMEALIRWKHPERGMVSPGEFVPILEETGMILDVGSWALRRAALEHAAWSARGRVPPRIAVNVSPAQLRRRDFVDYVKEALSPVERATERIDLEITESMLMEDIQGGIDKLKVVQKLGLHVALDDFGTGYSSLSYLARLPINSLKIDRSFITQMSKSPEQMAIVSTVISLARALNLRVVAEGVETEEQANLLRLLRCDEAQGFLFSRPLPPEDLEGKLRQA